MRQTWFNSIDLTTTFDLFKTQKVCAWLWDRAPPMLLFFTETKERRTKETKEEKWEIIKPLKVCASTKLSQVARIHASVSQIYNIVKQARLCEYNACRLIVSNWCHSNDDDDDDAPAAAAASMFFCSILTNSVNIPLVWHALPRYESTANNHFQSPPIHLQALK